MSELKNWLQEKKSAFLYQIMAQKEASAEQKRLFSQLADEAQNQAKAWEQKLAANGQTVPIFQPDARTRFVASLLTTFGARAIRPILAASKVRGLSTLAGAGHGMPIDVSEIGSRHRGSAVNWLRAAVFGVNDGLVSNTSLILGVAGAVADNHAILISGLAGLIAGAFSMACGEYISVRSQREFFESQIALEKAELDAYPEEEAAELALIFKSRGLDPDESLRIARKLIAQPQKALQTLAREELGIDPDELGSPWVAAASSFVSFAGGALLPLIPFLSNAHHELRFTIIFSAAALFIIGSIISLFTGRSACYGGFRMLIIGLGAGFGTYVIGHLLGAAVK